MGQIKPRKTPAVLRLKDGSIGRQSNSYAESTGKKGTKDYRNWDERYAIPVRGSGFAGAA
jgi:hypothetical protein